MKKPSDLPHNAQKFGNIIVKIRKTSVEIFAYAILRRFLTIKHNVNISIQTIVIQICAIKLLTAKMLAITSNMKMVHTDSILVYNVTNAIQDRYSKDSVVGQEETLESKVTFQDQKANSHLFVTITEFENMNINCILQNYNIYIK